MFKFKQLEIRSIKRTGLQQKAPIEALCFFFLGFFFPFALIGRLTAMIILHFHLQRQFKYGDFVAAIFGDYKDCFPASLSLCLSFCHSSAINLIQSDLFLELDKKSRPLMYLMVCLDVSEFWPVSQTLFSLSGFLIELSRLTSKTTYIRWLSLPLFKTMYIKLSATSANVFRWPFIFWTIAIPSITRAQGCGIISAAVMFFWAYLASDTLLVFLSDPSAEERAQGERSERVAQYIIHLRLPVISDYDHLNKQRTIRFNDYFLACPSMYFHLLWKSTNVLSLSFVILSWNFIFGSYLSWSLQKVL